MKLLSILIGIILILLLILVFLTNKKPSTTVVTAYYPVKKNKHGEAKYNTWMKLFFKNVTCPVICFCPKDRKDALLAMAGPNVNLVVREFNSFDMMSDKQMKIWNEFYKKDPEKEIHSPELYAVWAAKQEFVLTAMKKSYSDIYVWCDIGAFRTDHQGSFSNTYKYIVPNKITCLDIENTIGGGILAGDKEAWNTFSNNYLQELKSRPDGKDQNIFRKIINHTNAVIIKPTDKYGDPWFYLTYIFS